MKGIAILARSGIRSLHLFLILSYTISAVFLFSHSPSVYAQAPETEKIVFVSKRDGNAEIYIMNPDGSQLIFVVTGLKHTPLGLFDLQTRTQEVLRPEELPWTTSPRWSPQGDKIAFGKLSGARFNERGNLAFRKSTLYIANPDGTALQQVADGLAPYNPTWSPQGNQLIYNDIAADFFQLYKIDFNGGNPTQLTREGNNSSPAWSNPNVLKVSPSGHSLTTTWGKIKVN